MTDVDGAQPQAPQTPLIGQLLTPAEYATLGASMRSAGMTDAQIGQYFELVERTVLEAATQAARNVVLRLAPQTLQMTQNVHRAACLEIMHRIQSRQGGFGVLSHASCAQIAMDVSRQAPQHETRGPVRAGVLQPRQYP